MTLLLIKLFVTPLMVLAASLTGRRWGEAFGGWLVGLPLTSGPVAVFLAVEHGPGFALEASAGSLAGVAAQAGFCLGYAALASFGWPLGVAGGGLAYAGIAVALQYAQLSHAVLFLIALALALVALPKNAVARGVAAPPQWDIPLRIVVVTAFVIALTSFAATLGARASGVIASFPLIGAALAVFAQRAQGPMAGVDVLRGMAGALFGFAMFFYVLSLLLPRTGLPVAFCGAALSALLTQGLTLRSLRRPVAPAAG
jgi:hypothetical protein